MEISSIKPTDYSYPAASAQSTSDGAQRRELMQATKTVNASKMLGQNELVFMVDRATHRPIIRVEDPDTHEVLLQLPPEYVLRLAQELGSGTTHETTPSVDT